ncbi:hypothetical protein AB685_16635 [Bacillus sp. LL01]|nr:hypothetical protein AB685_16635 [Bacillus sp. LL01]
MKYIAIFLGMLGIFILVNFLFSLLYILSRSAGKGFYRWITYDLDFLEILSSPLFGITQWVAGVTYERFNWFVARVLLILYAIFILILSIVCFSMFWYIGDKY